MESTQNTTITDDRVEKLQDMANKLRIHSIEMTDASGSGYNKH